MSIEAVFPNAAQIDTQNAILARMAEKMGAFEKPTSFKGIQTFLRNGLIRHVLDESDQIQAALNINVTTEIRGTGVTAATVDKDTFLTTAGSHTHIHEFTYDGAAWLNNGEVVELKDYGITITGNPVSGDAVVCHVSSGKVDFDIMGIDEDCPVDKTKKHTLTLLAANCIENEVFDPPQYLYAVTAAAWPDGLPAGTYSVTLNHGSYAGNTAQDGTYKFTTTQTVPVGGGIRHSTIGAYQGSGYTKDQILGGKFTTYVADRIATLETLTTTEVTDADADVVNLGTATASDPQYLSGEYINYSQRNAYGSGRWGTSWIRQLLNSRDKVLNFVPATIWSRPARANAEGFLHRMDPELVAVIGKHRVRYALGIADRNGYEDLEDYVSLATMTDIGLGSNNGVQEGAVDESGNMLRTGSYSFWKGKGQEDRIKYLSSAARYWWLGSVFPWGASSVRSVYPSGALRSNDALNANGLVPRLTII